jgi:hypothetical protein
MSVTGGAATSTRRKKKKIAFSGVPWLPTKPMPKELLEIPFDEGVTIVLCSTSGTGVVATRSGNLITLSYSLRASRPIVFVTVTIQESGAAVASLPKIVPPWCLDLAGSSSPVVKLADTTVDFGALYSGKSVIITVTYDTDTTEAAGVLMATA